MKLPPALLHVAVLLWPLHMDAVSLPLRLQCLSVQCQPARTLVGSDPFLLGVGSTPFDVKNPNGDLTPVDAPVAGSPVKLGNLYALDTRFAAYFDDFFLWTPDVADADGDGIDDFYQTEQPVDGVTSQGYIEDGVDGAEFPLHATWNRAAGASSGTCRVSLQNATLPRAVPFDVPFEIPTFNGTWTTPATGTVTEGTVFGRQSEHATNTLLGNLKLTATGPDSVEVSAGSWVHSDGGATGFQAVTPLRRSGNKYVGLLRFARGLPPSQDGRRPYWLLILSDSRDFNGDGVPDLSDPAPSVPILPRLTVELRPAEILLHLGGATGESLVLERSSTLLPGGWTPVATVTLDGSNGTFSQPSATAGVTTFWRLRKP